MKKKTLALLGVMIIALISALSVKATETADSLAESHKTVHKILFIGDSMTGWLAERFNAYGKMNGFEVDAVIWDGSTIKKWGSSSRLAEIVKAQKPDAVFICLGLNELFERNPSTTLSVPVRNIIRALGGLPYVWIGPPSWPGKSGGTQLNQYLEHTLGASHYFNSSGLKLQRQSATNPHPSRQGIAQWVDHIMAWLPGSGSKVAFESMTRPATSQASRGKVYIYKKMKETL